MDYDIFGNDMQVVEVEVELDQGETFIAESGAINQLGWIARSPTNLRRATRESTAPTTAMAGNAQQARPLCSPTGFCICITDPLNQPTHLARLPCMTS